MRGLRTLTLVLLAASAFAPPLLRAQEAPDAIRQELAKIKKSRTLSLLPAQGTEDASGTTSLRLENASPFDLVVLVVGPTTARIELVPDRPQTLIVEPGDYEIAVTAAGATAVQRNVLSLYGKQTITPNLRFSHKFVIPGV